MLHEIILSGDKLNDYVEGRIAGALWVLLGMPETMHACGESEDGAWHIPFKCDDDIQFDAIKTIVEGMYTHIDIKVI